MKRKLIGYISGGVAAPRGFLSSSVAAGIKKERDDLALVVSEELAAAAAVFTVNKFPAAPIELCRRHLKLSAHRARAILINAGCANAGTGPDGLARAGRTVSKLASSLGVPESHVLVASTGVIGDPLPADKIVRALPELIGKLSRARWRQTARAICTTDTFEKTAAVRYGSGKKIVRIGGMAKGAGMIHPNMATMLCFLTTDAALTPALLNVALRRAVEHSFHCVTVDGDTSTNDMVSILANGCSGASGIDAPGSEFEKFCEALEETCVCLARLIASDGEGATHLVEIHTEGAKSFEEARRVGKAIALSPLVKTAIYGRDANWGRILSAIGNSNARVQADRVDVTVQGHEAVRRGVVIPSKLTTKSRLWKSRTFRIGVHLHDGKASATVWSCDLTHQYVDINASYRS